MSSVVLKSSASDIQGWQIQINNSFRGGVALKRRSADSRRTSVIHSQKEREKMAVKGWLLSWISFQRVYKESQRCDLIQSSFFVNSSANTPQSF
jgi:hypothetical protein